MLTGTTFDKVYEDQEYNKETQAWPMNAGTTDECRLLPQPLLLSPCAPILVISVASISDLSLLLIPY